MSEEEIQEAPVEAAPEAEAAPVEATAPEAPVEQQADYWGQFKGLPQFEGMSERDVAANLYQSMEREKAASGALAQYQQVLPYAQDYMANKREFDAWRQQQQSQSQQTQAVTQEVKKAWQPPELKDNYRRYLTKDENGRDVISDDAPLDARQQLIEHMNYRADFAQKFLDNPEQALGPMIQQMAQDKAQELINSSFDQRENEQFISQVEEENKDWIIDSESGKVTPEGFLVHKYIEQARDNGINGPKARWSYAIAMTERDMLAQRYEGEGQQAQQFVDTAMQAQPEAPAPQPEQPAPEPKDTANQNMEYLRREASRNPSRSAGRGIDNGQKPKGQNISFEDMLTNDLSSKGFI
jgi:hypothetical protein